MTAATGERCPDAMGAWVDRMQRWRWWVALLALLLTVASLGYTVRNLGISTDTVDMLSQDVPFRQHAHEYNAAFPDLNHQIAAVVDAPTPEQSEELVRALKDRMDGSEAIRRIYWPGGGFLREHAFLFLSPDSLAALVDDLAAAEPILSILAQDPTLAGLAELLTLAADREDGAEGPEELEGLDRLLDEMALSAEAMARDAPHDLSWQSLMAAENGEATPSTRQFLLLRPELDFNRLKPAAAAISELRGTVTAVEEEAGLPGTVRLSGDAMITHEELESVEAGGSLAAGLSLILVSAILALGLRAPRLVAASLTTLVVGLTWTAGLATLTVGQLNLISVAFAVLFVGLGIDFCIHFALRYREAHREGVEAAIATAGHGVGCALLLSAVCAAIGFVSFLPTDYLGLAELGLISGMGMFVAVLASLTVLPALLGIFHPRRGPGLATRPISMQRPMVSRFRRPVLGVALAVGLVGAVLTPLIRFDLNPINLRDQEAESIQVFHSLAEEVESTPYVVNVLGDDLEEAQALAAAFRAEAAVGSARTLASFVPEEQDEKLAILEDAAFFLAPMLLRAEPESPLSPEARAAAFADVEAALASLGAGGDGATATAARRVEAALAELGDSPDIAALEGRWLRHLPATLDFLAEALTVEGVAREDLPEELTRRWLAEDGRARVEMRPAEVLTTNAEISRFAEVAQALDHRVTGSPIVIREASRAVVGAFQEATLYAALGVLALLAIALRRPTDVVLAVVPLALAAVLTLGTAVLLGISLNFANVIVLPLLMGLGVSSGIHLVLRARHTENGSDVLRTSTPRAVLLSVGTTLASFGTLGLSPHQGMSSMGTLLTIAGAYTLISVLIVLPCLLEEFQVRRRK